METQKCVKCKTDKNMSCFSKNPKTKSGLQSWCRECYRENSRRIYAKNPQQKKEYRNANIKKIKAREKEYYERNREKKLIKVKEYYKRNYDKIRIKVTAHNQRRRALKLETQTELIYSIEIFERDKWICGICGKKVNSRIKFPNPKSASLDHVIPLSKGGTHTKTNVQCTHWGCNLCKNAHPSGTLF